jgi:hypothetical protein
MANITFFRGEDSIIEFGYQGESIDKTDVATAATPTEALRYTQSLAIRINENVTRNKFVGAAGGRNSTVDLKGIHEASATWSFWLSKDMGQTDAQEGYFLKMPIDGTDTDSSNVYTIPDSADEYGDDYLKVFTIEAGWVKSSNDIPLRLTGCIVNRMTFHAEEGTNCLWTYDILAAKGEALTSSGFSAGAIAESTEKPFHWGDTLIQYDDAGGGPTALDGIEMIDFIVDNKVIPVRDLANTTTSRSPSMWIVGDSPGPEPGRAISGTMRIKMTTAAENGQDLWEDLFGDSTGDSAPSETLIPKDIIVTLYVDATYYVKYTLHDVIIGNLDPDLKGSGVSRIVVPFTAQACILTMKMHTSATEPTGWAE